MGEWLRLKAADGFELGGYVARPESEPRAGLVVVQEIFGVNAHIRRVTDGWAAEGYLAVAPAIFDRIEPGVDLGYEGADMEKARSFFPKLNMDAMAADVAAAMEYAGQATGKKVGVIGYCLGGSLAWLAATRLGAAAAVGYYGGRIAHYANETPHCPVMLHFGREDQHIPADDVAKVRAAHPETEIYWYDAGHGFNCDARASYNATAAEIARGRSAEFLNKYIG